MTAWVWLFCTEHPPYNTCAIQWRFDVESGEAARRLAASAHPDAPPLTGWIVIDCDKPQCSSRLEFTQGNITTIADARAKAATWNIGWCAEVHDGKTRDFCQLHTTHQRDPAPPAEEQRGHPVEVDGQVVGYQDELFDLDPAPAPNRSPLL